MKHPGSVGQAPPPPVRVAAAEVDGGLHGPRTPGEHQGRVPHPVGQGRLRVPGGLAMLPYLAYTTITSTMINNSITSIIITTNAIISTASTSS